jgi:hypothetical protein
MVALDAQSDVCAPLLLLAFRTAVPAWRFFHRQVRTDGPKIDDPAQWR